MRFKVWGLWWVSGCKIHGQSEDYGVWNLEFGFADDACPAFRPYCSNPWRHRTVPMDFFDYGGVRTSTVTVVRNEDSPGFADEEASAALRFKPATIKTSTSVSTCHSEDYDDHS